MVALAWSLALSDGLESASWCWWCSGDKGGGRLDCKRVCVLGGTVSGLNQGHRCCQGAPTCHGTCAPCHVTCALHSGHFARSLGCRLCGGGGLKTASAGLVAYSLRKCGVLSVRVSTLVGRVHICPTLRSTDASAQALTAHSTLHPSFLPHVPCPWTSPRLPLPELPQGTLNTGPPVSTLQNQKSIRRPLCNLRGSWTRPTCLPGTVSKRPEPQLCYQPKVVLVILPATPSPSCECQSECHTPCSLDSLPSLPHSRCSCRCSCRFSCRCRSPAVLLA